MTLCRSATEVVLSFLLFCVFGDLLVIVSSGRDRKYTSLWGLHDEDFRSYTWDGNPRRPDAFRESLPQSSSSWSPDTPSRSRHNSKSSWVEITSHSNSDSPERTRLAQGRNHGSGRKHKAYGGTSEGGRRAWTKDYLAGRDPVSGISLHDIYRPRHQSVIGLKSPEVSLRGSGAFIGNESRHRQRGSHLSSTSDLGGDSKLHFSGDGSRVGDRAGSYYKPTEYLQHSRTGGRKQDASQYEHHHVKNFDWDLPSGHNLESVGPRPHYHSPPTYQSHRRQHGNNPGTRDGHPSHQRNVSRRPNIVLILTDDQDIELGSLNYMPRLMNLMGASGSVFPNAFTSTPMCCPSRSSMLTGMYIHNHEVYTNNDNCSSLLWQTTHEKRTFATYLSQEGYRTGYFGKYLNKYNGSHVPEGWHEWTGLMMNSRYYNYTVNKNNNKIKFGDKYPQDYFPHVITREGIQFLQSNKKLNPPPPMMLVFSYPAPHGPEDSAPEHAHKFFNASDHHTAAYNYAPNPDKQWLLQFTDRMEDIQLKFTDLLMTKRLQTLQTIDEAVEKIINKLKELGELDNTYIFYTSDHGYHLGQFGLVKGKSMPLEFDVKVPFFVRGPGIKGGTKPLHIALNIDLAPTFLDIAGMSIPHHMDGRSLLPLLRSTRSENQNAFSWRTSFLIESSGKHREEEVLEKKEQKRWQRMNAEAASPVSAEDNPFASTHVSLYTSKHELLQEVCKKKQYHAPCQINQKWMCVHNGQRWRLQKCRSISAIIRRNCICGQDAQVGYLARLDPVERQKQRKFIRKHVSQDLLSSGPKFIKAFMNIYADDVKQTVRRKRRNRYSRSLPDAEGGPAVENEQVVNQDQVQEFVEEEELRDIDDQIHEITDELENLQIVSSTKTPASTVFNNSSSKTGVPFIKLQHGCRAIDSGVDCQQEVYQNPKFWKNSKTAIDDKIRRLREQLSIMKNIRKHLRDLRPDASTDSLDFADFDDDEDSLEFIGSGDYILRVNDYKDDSAVSVKNSSVPDIFGPGSSNIDYPDFSFIGENARSTNGSDNDFEASYNGSVILSDHKDALTREPAMLYGYNETDTVEESDADYESTLVEEEEDEEEEIWRATTERGATSGGAGNYFKVSSWDTEDLLHPSQHVTSYAPVYPFSDHQDFFPKRHRGRKKHRGNTYGGRGRNRFAVHNKFKLQQVEIPADPESYELDNETSPRKICWCSRRIATKIALQQERQRKRLERQRLKEERHRRREEKRLRRKSRNNLEECNVLKLNCYTHDNNHWRTPPLWTDGKFCFCMNAANNTYWCVRTINDTHNFLYCEFITGLITYYDLNIDPYQLRNVAFTLSSEELLDLHSRLETLRTCSGADECDGFESLPPDEVKEHLHPKDTESKYISELMNRTSQDAQSGVYSFHPLGMPGEAGEEEKTIAELNIDNQKLLDQVTENPSYTSEHLLSNKMESTTGHMIGRGFTSESAGFKDGEELAEDLTHFYDFSGSRRQKKANKRKKHKQERRLRNGRKQKKKKGQLLDLFTSSLLEPKKQETDHKKRLAEKARRRRRRKKRQHRWQRDDGLLLNWRN